MIEVDNKTNYNINMSPIESVVQLLSIKQDIELIIVGNEEIKNINKEHRGIDKATDVLSFPISHIEHMPLGSIIISIDKAIEVANNLKHSIDNEITLLFIHGILHLLGYNHETDNGEMRTKEAEIINALSLPTSLIVRTEGK